MYVMQGKMEENPGKRLKVKGIEWNEARIEAADWTEVWSSYNISVILRSTSYTN
jgi:hypothetical protein